MKKYLLLILCLLIAPTALAQSPDEESRVVIDGRYFYVHTVMPGETLYSLARRYGVGEQQVIDHNPAAAGGLRAGEAIRIPAPAPVPLPRNLRERRSSNRQVEVHTVVAGETAYSLARYYAVSIDDLIEWNPGLDPARLSVGQTIRLPRRVVGNATPREIDAGFSRYADALSDASAEFDYHLVQPRETLYSLSRALGVTEEILREYNPEALAGGLKAGSLLRYPPETVPADLPTESVKIPDATDDFDKPFDPTAPMGGYGEVEMRRVDPAGPLRVALLMPFTDADGAPDNNMISYYNGTLLALEELRGAGISVDLSVFDTRGSTRETERILGEDALARADLIIGPHDPDQFDLAARFAYRQRVPIVSPQALVDTGNPMVWQARPSEESRYDKIRELLVPDQNIILITPASGRDSAFLATIEGMLPPSAKRVGTVSEYAIRSQLSTDTPNLIVVPTADPTVTDNILERISSIQNDYSARTGRGYPIRVVGTPEWYGFPMERVDRNLYFKLGVTYAALYYADRVDRAVAAFDDRYFAAFGNPLPPRFAYRGYDVAKLFILALKQYGDRFPSLIDRVEADTLAPYRFVRDGLGRVNDQWMLVRYQADYTVEKE